MTCFNRMPQPSETAPAHLLTSRSKTCLRAGGSQVGCEVQHVINQGTGRQTCLPDPWNRFPVCSRALQAETHMKRTSSCGSDKEPRRLLCAPAPSAAARGSSQAMASAPCDLPAAPSLCALSVLVMPWPASPVPDDARRPPLPAGPAPMCTCSAACMGWCMRSRRHAGGLPMAEEWQQTCLVADCDSVQICMRHGRSGQGSAMPCALRAVGRTA